MAQYLHLIGPAVLISISVPLAFFALLTSVLAFSTLLLRASIIYAELGFAIFHSWLSAANSIDRVPGSKPPVPRLRAPSQARPRQQPIGDLAAPSFVDSSQDPKPSRSNIPSSESFTSLLGAGAPNRDFEGVGGWRLSKAGQDETAWTSFNTRLQLPAATGERRRKHKRSLTSQSQRFARSPETLRTSPVRSRNRSPPTAPQRNDSQEGYFDSQGQMTPISPEEIATTTRMDERRLSVSSSNASSAVDLKMLTSTLTHILPP